MKKSDILAEMLTLLAEIQKDASNFKNASYRLRKNKNFCLSAILVNPKCYLIKSFLMRTDKDIIKAIIDTNIIYLISELEYDKELLEKDKEYKEMYNKTRKAGITYNSLEFIGGSLIDFNDIESSRNFYLQLNNLKFGEEDAFMKRYLNNSEVASQTKEKRL